MPIIPRANPADVSRIDPLPGVRNTTRVSSEGGERMGAAIAGIGEIAGKIGQQMQDKADTAAYMEAQRKLSDWRNQWHDPNNAQGVTAYKGREALKLHEAMLPDFDRVAGEIAQSLPSERARQKFTEFATGERVQTYGEINRYATAQNEAYIAAERAAFTETAANDLVRAQLTDPDDYKRRWATTLETMYATGAANGEPVAETRLRIGKLQSAVHANVLDQLQSTDAIAASEYYAQHSDEMQEDDRARALRTLQPLFDDKRAEDDAEAAINGGTFYEAAPPKPRGQPSAAIKQAIIDAATAEGVPPAYLLALAEQESSFRPDAKGSVLDDGDRATGLFQYRKTTADALGIDRTDPVASARAAAREFKQRMDKHGVDFAIAAHFGGDGGADAVVNRGRRGQNPLTAAYLEEVKGRAKRWSGAMGGVTDAQEQGRVAGFMGRADEATALERVQAIADPARRRIAEAKVRDRFQIEKLREQEADRATVEQINTAVWTGDPNLPLKQLLGPEGYAYAARKGQIGALENDLKYRRESPVRTDNAEVVGKYLSALRENPKAFAKMDVMKNARHISDETAKSLVKLQGEIREGKYDAAEFGSESDQLAALVFAPLNMVGETTEAKKKRAEFETAWYGQKAEWSRNNPGKKLTADVRDQMIRRLRVSFALHGVKGFADASFAPTMQQKQQAAKWLRDTKGIKNPTDEQVNRVILLASANG